MGDESNPLLPMLPSFTIAFVNCQSGGGQGGELVVLLEKLWGGGKGIVVDLCCQQKYPHTKKLGIWFPFGVLEGVGTIGLTILSCGGDGTHSWVWSALASFYAGNVATNGIVVVPVPIGSGNDISNTLGWGKSLCLSNVENFLIRLGEGEPVAMDRWSAVFDNLQPRGHHDGKSFQWQNYLSLGFDAKVAYEFENCRQCCCGCCFASVVANQCWYATIGTTKICECCFDVGDVATFYTRGHPNAPWDHLDVPPGTQAVLLCNIASYGAGMNMWDPHARPGSNPELLNDGKLELVALSGPFNFACGRCGCCGFHKLAQSSEVKIALTTTVCISADGEGWSEAVENGSVTCIEISRQGIINTIMAKD